MGSDILIFIGVFSFFVIIGILVGGGAERKQMLKRIERIKQRKVAAAKSVQDVSLRRKTNEKRGLMYWLSKPLPDFKKLGYRLERAGKTITPKQFVMRRLIWVGIIVFVVSVVFKKRLLMGLFLGIIFGVWVPLKLLDRKIKKQSKAFLQVFPDAIDLIVRGLRSGLPVSESLNLVSTEIPEPVGGVFLNIANTMKLGVSLEKALQETAKKLDMTEFNFFTTSIILQRETGGNLSEILNNLSDVLRNRYLMRMKIRAMSSEARASAYIIGCLPFVVMILVTVVSPDYMSPLYNDYRGNICAAVAAGMMLFGGWVMKRMTSFEI